MSRDEEAILIGLEKSLWRPETRFDRNYMETTLAPDFFEFGRSGRVYKRDDTLAVEDQGAEATLKNFDVRLIDENVALVAYFSDVMFGSVRETANRSSIWSKTRAVWTLRFHQGTPTDP